MKSATQHDPMNEAPYLRFAPLPAGSDVLALERSLLDEISHDNYDDILVDMTFWSYDQAQRTFWRAYSTAKSKA